MIRPRFLAALWAGKLTRVAVNLIDKKRGTNLPGAVALRVDPQFMRRVSGVSAEKVIATTGTNGKSTSNNMIVHVLRAAGYRVASNLEGANMVGGVATALVDNSSMGGKLQADWLCLEVDERSLGAVSRALPIGTLAVTNIQKDQVQRNGEPDYILQKIRRSLVTPEADSATGTSRTNAATDGTAPAHQPTAPAVSAPAPSSPNQVASTPLLVLNDDEPNSRSLATTGLPTLFYGVDENSRSQRHTSPYAVTMPCAACGRGRIEFDYQNISNIGPFRCSVCGFGSSQADGVRLTQVDFDKATFTADSHTFPMPYTQSFFTYSYALTVALAKHLGITPRITAQALGNFVNVAGRTETLTYAGKTIHYLRIKQENPDTLQSAFNAIAAAPGDSKTLILGLCELTDFQPFYTNTFYVYDTEVGVLTEGGVTETICFSKHVAIDTAAAMENCGYPASATKVLPTDEVADVLEAIRQSPNDEIFLITWLGWYSQMQAEIERRKH